MAAVRLADLVGSIVRTAEGTKLGRVADLRITQGPMYQIVGLELGMHGVLTRLDIPGGRLRSLEDSQRPTFVPWDAVDSFDGTTVVLRVGREPRGVG